MTGRLPRGPRRDCRGAVSLLVAVLVSTGAAHAEFCPGTGDVYSTTDEPTGDAPLAVRTCDVDGDGHSDLVVANDASDTVSVLLNQGDGTYGPKTRWPVDSNAKAISEPVDVACCDVNGDVLTDLITVNHTSDNISILLNMGGAQFAAPVHHTVGEAPFGIECADLDGINGPDLITTNFTSDSISVLLNDGTGVFPPHVEYPAGDAPIAMAVCDVNADGHLDVTTADMLDKTVSVLTNDGAGAFATFATVDLCPGPADCVNPFDIACCDLDGVNGPDVVTANGIADTVIVLLNDGSSVPGGLTSYGVLDGAYSLTCCDVDGDNALDVVTANLVSDDLGVLLNGGGGLLDPPTFLPVGGGSGADPSSVTCINIDNDADLDLATAFLDGVTVFENDCSGGACSSDADCDDGDACTTDTCDLLTGDCEFTPIECPPGETCVDGVCQSGCVEDADCDDGDACTTDTCDAEGACRNEPKTCDSPDPCMVGTCDPGTGNCQFSPVECPPDEVCVGGTCETGCMEPADCDDGVACTIDTCETVGSETICVYTPDDSLCDTGLFCSAQRCDAQLGCVFDHECTSSDGNPCPDNAECDEATDSCGGCFAPTAVAAGGRYLSITPADQGGTPVALLVEGDCSDGSIACVSKYVQSFCEGGSNDGVVCASQADCPRTCATGPKAGLPCSSDLDCNAGGGACQGSCEKSLGDIPVFLTSAEWATVNVTGEVIRPGSLYRVAADCDFSGQRVLSAAAEMTTWQWGDASGDDTVNVLDIGKTVEVVKGVVSTATFESTNIAPCGTDRITNVLDIGTVVDAVKGLPNPCQPVCP